MLNQHEAAIKTNTMLSFPVAAPRSNVFARLRYWWCLAAAAVLLLVVGAPAVAFLWIINRREALYPIALWGAKTWLSACGAEVKVTARAELDPNRSYVFASNHRSYLDTAALFRYAGKRMGIVAKKELLKVPVLGQGMGFVNIIAIDRSNPDRALQTMQKARDVMNDGYSFGVFVEGTRAMPGELLPFKKGAFHLAAQTEAAIVPVAIKNTDWMMGKHTGAAFPGTIEMVLLPPIETRIDNTNACDVAELMMRVRAAIAAELAKA